MTREELLAWVDARIYQNINKAITGQVHQDVDNTTINETWDKIEALRFTNLVDVPSSYSGQGGKVVKVKTDLSGLEFQDETVGGDFSGPSSSIDGRPVVFNGTSGKVGKQGPALGNAAYANVGIAAGTVAAGNDPRFSALPSPSYQYLLPYARMSGPGTYDLEYVYGLNWRNGMFYLKDLYSLAQAQVKFDKLFSWYLAAGKTTTWVMNMAHYPACHNEAVLQGHTAGNWGSGRIDSRNGVICPSGHFKVNFGAKVDGGIYTGVSSSGTYQGAIGTVLIMDKDNWQDTTDLYDVGVYTGIPLRLLHRPTTLDASSIWTAYQENVGVYNFRYEGLCNWLAHDPTYFAGGLGLFRSGENATVDRLFASGFNGVGIFNVGPTPLNIGTVSVFQNTYGGFGHYGGSLSTMNIDLLSGDDNPCLFRVDSFKAGSDDMRAGGAVNVGAIKQESGKRDPQRGQIVLMADGHTGSFSNEGADLSLVIGNVQFDMDVKVVDSLFVANGFTDSPAARGTTSGNRKARVSVGSFQARNYRTVLQDVDRKKRWQSDGDYVKMGFVWNARLSDPALAMYTYPCDLPAPLTSGTVNALGRLGIVNSGDPYDYAAGTPTYNEETVTPIVVPTSTPQTIYAAVTPSIVTNGQTAQCVATSIDYELRTIPTGTLTWYILDGPATINSSGVVTTMGTGVVTIKVNGNGGEGRCYLNVTA